MTTIEAVQGDLTREAVDAIVNAANSELLGGGGVDGAIRRAGGEAIDDECLALRRGALPDGLPVGDAVATTAGSLPSRWVVHTVGPRYRGDGSDAALLASCHRCSLEVAHALGARSIAFPAVSCGIFGYPVEEAAPIAVAAVREYVEEHPEAFDVVRFVLVDPPVHDVFARALGASS